MPGRLNRVQRLTKAIKSIPDHDGLEFDTLAAALKITIDYQRSLSPFRRQQFGNSLLEILPLYAKHARNIHIHMILKPPNMDETDVTNPPRHELLLKIMEELNKLDHIDSIKFVMTLDRIHWEQIKPAAALYALEFEDWEFDLLLRGAKVHPIKVGSSLDRRLQARFRLGAKARNEMVDGGAE